MKNLLNVPGKATVTLGAVLARLLRAILRSASDLPKMLVKPRLLGVWLLRSHIAQLLLIATLLLTPQVLPDAGDRLLEKIYRPDNARLLGMDLPVKTNHPLLKTRQGQARWLIRYGSGTLVLLFFWLAIPAALRRGERMAHAREAKADSLLGSTPSQSVLLYRSALTYATDGEHVAILRTKLDALDQSVTETAPAVSGKATVPMRPAKPKAKAKTKAKKGGATGPRYVTERELGRGSMGVVLLARDTVLERKVAIKELPHAVADDPELLERFQREAKALARLNHPGIVQVYDFAEFQGRPWIVMEFVEGRELEDMGRDTGPMDPTEVVRLGKGMAEALQYAHERGVLHRDLKPANVLVDEQGQPKVMDFGVARLALSGAHTQPGTLLGSPSYMSPEQARGQAVDARTDVYALGSIFYGLLTGERMFDGTIEEVIALVLGQNPVPIRRVIKKTPLRLARLVMSMVAKNPKERPDSMAAVLDELNQMRFRG